MTLFHCVSYIASNDGLIVNYEGRLKSSWTHLITPSQNFVEVW
jgi:hypothetical protein